MTDDVFRDGRFEPDPWRILADTDPIPTSGRVLVPLLRWREAGAAFAESAARIGLVLSGDDPVEAVGREANLFDVIAIRFTVFSDGRGYSLARLLRERYGFAGDLRAIGDVLSDQVPFLWRCGFTSLKVAHAPTRAALAAGTITGLPLHLQPLRADEPALAGRRPWLRAARAGRFGNVAGC